MKKDLEMAFNANIVTSNATDNAINAIDDRINAINDVVDELAEIDVDKDIINMEDYVENHKKFQLISVNLNALEQSFSSAKINSEI